MTDRPHDGRGNWLDVDDASEDVKLLRGIQRDIRSILYLLIAWSLVVAAGVVVSIVLAVVAASEAAS